MENCFNIDLKVKTDNINLPYLDYSKVYYKTIDNPSDKSQGIRGYDDMCVNGKLKCVGNLYFADSSLVSTGSKEYTLPNPGHENQVYLTNAEGALLVSKNATSISSIAGAGSVQKAYYIKTAEFRDITALTSIGMAKTDSIGSILDFVQCVGITSITFSYAIGVSGDVVDFLEKQIDDYGRTSGTITFSLAYSSCRIKPGTAATDVYYTATITDSTHFTIVNSSATKTWNGTKSGGNWTIVNS